MINVALKYAFPVSRPDAKVLVTYESHGTDCFSLVVSYNGIGKAVATGAGDAGWAGNSDHRRPGSDSSTARMEVLNAPPGVSVAITRASFPSRAPLAA